MTPGRDIEKEISDLENSKRVCERITAALRECNYAGAHLEVGLENISFLTYVSRQIDSSIDALEQEAKVVPEAPKAE